MNLQMVEVDHNRFAVEVKDGNVSVNLTKMAKPFGKRPETWLKTEETQDYLAALAVTLKSVTADLTRVIRGGTPDAQGTWAFDYRIAMRFAQWLSPEFSIAVDELLVKLLTGRATVNESAPWREERMREYICSCVDRYLERKSPALASLPVTVALPELDVREDADAHRFFDGYCPNKELSWVHLDKYIAAEYYANACVLNAIAGLLRKRYGTKGHSRKYSQVIFWSQAAELVRRVNIERFPHSLPEHPRRLRAKYMNYIRDGYESLVRRSMGNQNARKK